MCRYAIRNVSSSSYVRISRVTLVTGKGPTSATHEGTIPCDSDGGEIRCWLWAWARVDLNDKLDRDAGTVRNRKLPRRYIVWEALSKKRWKTCPDFVQKRRNKEKSKELREFIVLCDKKSNSLKTQRTFTYFSKKF